jgi:hypothetical protein
MTYADAEKFEIINGYKCLKPANQSKDGLWSVFKDVELDIYQNGTDFDPQLAAERVARQAEKFLKELEAKEWLALNSLSVQKRHEFYSQILAELTLDADSDADLKARGLTDAEIEKSDFKSYSYGQRLTGNYPESLPGIKEGNQLNASNGYLIPCRDFNGNITGLQMRLQNPSNNNRYLWLSNGNGLLRLQPENENPLALYHPITAPKGIALVEGTGAKPYFVAQRLGYLVIGAAGGQWLSSPKLLTKYINQVFEKYGKLPVTIFPDAGFGLNLKVANKIKNLIEWLQEKEKGLFKPDEIFVADWNQITKAVGDIDEITNFEHIRYLKGYSFLKKYKQVFENGKRFKYWADSRAKFTADIIQNERWLTIPKGIEKECDILMIRKGLGGGKTQGLLEFLRSQNVVTILEGYRNSLLNQTVTRANEIGLNALHIKDSSEFIKGFGVISHTADSSNKLFAGCADSFHKLDKVREFNPEYYLAIDEICSVLHHLKGGGTLKARRKKAIEWTVSAINQAQFTIMMDANLSDSEVNFIKELYPDKKVKVIDSLHTINPRTFYFVETRDDRRGADFSSNKDYLPSHLIEKAKDCKKLLWLSDSQRSCEVSDRIITELGLKTFRLDGKTSQEDLSKEFLSNPKLFITTEQIDASMISPSAESGLSIDLYDYFDAVFFDIRGTVGVNTLVQLSARLRDTKVPIYVSCPEFANMTKNECPYPLKEIEKIFQERSDMLSAMVLKADPSTIDSQFIVNMFASIAQDAVKDIWTVETLKDSIKLVHEHQNLKLYLKTALQQAGNITHDLVQDKNENVKAEVKIAKETVMKLQAEKIYNSVDLTKEQVEELERKEVDYDTQCAIRKAKLKEKLPGIENTESWTPDFIYAVELKETKFLYGFWELQKLKNEKLVDAELKLQMQKKIEYGLSSMDVWKHKATKREALKLLGILEVIEAESFSCKQENIRKIIDTYYQDDSYFNLTGITKALVSEKQPSKHIKNMINKFLEMFGLETELINKNNDERHYRACVPPDIKPYLKDISTCYQEKAATVIDEAEGWNLKTVADMQESWLEIQKNTTATNVGLSNF